MLAAAVEAVRHIINVASDTSHSRAPRAAPTRGERHNYWSVSGHMLSIAKLVSLLPARRTGRVEGELLNPARGSQHQLASYVGGKLFSPKRRDMVL